MNDNDIAKISYDYKPDTDYTLEIIVCNQSYIVLLNSEKIYEDYCEILDYGTVGLRSWNTRYECSEFTVRSLGTDDYELFGEYTKSVYLPVNWTCSDYKPDKTGKYGFFGTVNSDIITEGVARTKVIVTVTDSAVNEKDSASQPLESDYEVEAVDNISVNTGLNIEEVISTLPTELSVLIPMDIPDSLDSEILFNGVFASVDEFLEDWILDDNSTDIHDGRFEVLEQRENTRGYINYKEWSKYNNNTGEGHGFANYAVKAVLRSTEDIPYNSFGIIFRASDISPTDGNSFNGYYVWSMVGMKSKD